MKPAEASIDTQVTEYHDTQKQVREAAHDFIRDLGHELSAGKLTIPAFPDAAMRIKTALEDPDVSADKVARAVGSDPVFSARLLKVANSALVNGAGERIDDLKMAVTRMGFKLAYNTAVLIAVEQVMSAHDSRLLHPHLEALWHHSVQVAAYSYAIAKQKTSIKPDSAMLAGLLHDIGKFYILAKAEHYPNLFSNTPALEGILDEWHTGVGRSIMEAWHFSEEMCLAADEHEELARTHDNPADLTDVVMVANLFSHKDEDEFIPALEWDAIPATQRLQLSKEDAVEIMLASQVEIDTIMQLLKA